jgi:uncharacterized RDD family membrane protein YckC
MNHGDPRYQDGPGYSSTPPGQQQPMGGYGAPGPAPQPASPPLAEWWQRLLARVIDGVILGVGYAVLSLILTLVLVGGDGSGLFLASLLTAVLAAGGYFAYEYVMLGKGGQTVGKMVLGLRVVPVGGAAGPGGLPSDLAVKRAGVLWGPLALSFIPVIGFIAYLGYVVNVLWQFWDKPLQQCLHDKAAGTMVIVTGKSRI